MTLILGIGNSELPWGKSGSVTPADAIRICQEVAAVGATSIRMSALWGLLDPNNNHQYKWADLDAAIAAAEAAGLDVLLICEPKRMSFWSAFGIPTAVSDTSTNVKNYGLFCGAIAQRYADRDVIKQFEIGNEVNNKANMTSPKDPSKYVDFLRAAYTNITTYVPDATVLAGALMAVATDPWLTQASLHPVEWVQRFYDCKPQEWFNGLSMHPYSTDGHYHPMTPTADNEYAFKNITAIRAIMDANGDGPGGRDIKIYCTEWGYDAVRSLTGLSTTRDQLEAEQALNIGTHFNLLKPYADLGYIYGTTWEYNYHDHNSKSDPAYSYGAVRYDFSRRPAWYTLQSFSGGLDVDPPTITASAVVPAPEVDVYVDPTHPIVPVIRADGSVPAPSLVSSAAAPPIPATASVPIPIVDVVTPDVSWVSSGAGDRDTTIGLEIILTWDHVVAATSYGALETGLVVSTDHAKPWELYNTLSVSSSIDGALTRLGSRHISSSSDKKGSLHLFGLTDPVDLSKPQVPTAGTHTITAHVKLTDDFVTSLTAVAGSSDLYRNVERFGTVYSNGNVSGTPNILMYSTTGNRAVCVLGGTGDLNPTFNKTVRYHAGSTVDGHGDYILIGDAPGASEVNFLTTIDFQRYGALAIDLIARHT